MEAAVEQHPDHSSTENVKISEVDYQASLQDDPNLKPNGVAETDNVVQSELGGASLPTGKLDASTTELVAEEAVVSECDLNTTQSLDVGESEGLFEDTAPADTVSADTACAEVVSFDAELVENQNLADDTSMVIGEQQEVSSELTSDTIVIQNKNPVLNVVDTVGEASETTIPDSVGGDGDNMRFETEVVVETNDTEVSEVEPNVKKSQNNHNILNEMNQNIELSEVLISSDVTENVENNNCSIRQEVFNKEELLDILEGNDAQCTEHQVLQASQIDTKIKETKMALEQLTRLKKSRRHRFSDAIIQAPALKKKKKVKKVNETDEEDSIVNAKKVIKVNEMAKEDSIVNAKKVKKINEMANEDSIVNAKKVKKVNEMANEDSIVNAKKVKKVNETTKEDSIVNTKKVKKVNETAKEDSIVNALVKDWEDDTEETDSLNKKDISSNDSEQLSESTASAIKVEKRGSVDSSTSDGQNSAVNKSVDDGQPQRRLGRVIKKKVIFDPDNPDTFTKGKTQIKSKEPQIDKDQPPIKKGKIEPIEQRAKSKSPVSKMQWKKPSSKNIKQNKRLSEVDKLLMDEGAVNMIYQLTPEAPKGKKNMRTKAEFIKKIQSSTPKSKEMKFRERKKECKIEDGEMAKKILGGKQRSSLSSSIKSPSVCEDFETHSADDSIIYRRHSSSSYSSSCMSPRRLSDVEAGVHQNANVSQQQNEVQSPHTVKPEGDNNHFGEGDLQANSGKDIINKDDCLSIKKKLNSKLSLALNKRKRDSSKAEKPLKKQPKLNESELQHQLDRFQFLTIKIYQQVAEICIRNAKNKLSTQIMKEMIEALSYVDLRTDTSVTLLTSECGTLCSELDLSPSLHSHLEERTKAANEIAETIRSLLWAVVQHSKLTCVAARGVCAGVALALVALADVALAAEGATFALAHRPAAPPASGIAAVVVSYRQLPQPLLNDLVVFGRRLSSSEALQGGLVSRVLCSAGFSVQLQAVVREIASEPIETLLMKKKLLGLRKPSDNVFLSSLETEKNLMVKYWTSDDGQEAIRTTVLQELKL